jgi:ribose 5-phosphate isomerase A
VAVVAHMASRLPHGCLPANRDLDYRKLSDRLGEKWKAGIPIEVDPFFARDLIADLKDMGALDPRVRLGLPAKAGECVTDNGNWLIDAPFKPLLLPEDLIRLSVDGMGADGVWEISALAAALNNLPGVVETGLFYGVNGVEAEASAKAGKRQLAQKPVAAYFGMDNGQVQIRKA